MDAELRGKTMSDVKFHPLYEDFLLHAEPPVKYKASGPTFAEALREANEVLAQLAKERCSCCNQLFQPGIGVFTEHAYFIPTSDICGECLDVRNWTPRKTFQARYFERPEEN
jgi:hypothetical protein